MSRDAKMDLHGVRTASDLERKYQFNKSFAEIAGIATDARTTAQQAKQEVIAVDESLTSEEIFNRLTNNGEEQGIYREDGKIYINAEYVNFDELNGKSLNLTGKLTCTTNAYIPPGWEELEIIDAASNGMELPAEAIPLYDFNGDGRVNSADYLLGMMYIMGTADFSKCPSAVATPIQTVIDIQNPDKAITFTGKNMWGRDLSGYIGINGTSIPHTGTKDYVVEMATDMLLDGYNGTWAYHKWNSGLCELWTTLEITHPSGGGISEIVNRVPLPFAVTGTKAFCQGGAYGWNLSRPIYAAVGSESVSVYLYPSSDMAGTVYTVYLQVVGKWK